MRSASGPATSASWSLTTSDYEGLDRRLGLPPLTSTASLEVIGASDALSHLAELKAAC